MSLALGRELEARRAGGRRLLVAYLMAGSTPTWLETAEALVAAGADALEVGLPFSDPIIDGPVIQDAAARALRAGTTISTVASALAASAPSVPLVAMTYLNVVLAHGYERSAGLLHDGGVTGAILPDLPVEELDAWQGAANARGIETVLLAAPTTPPERLDALCARTQGFCYAVGRMATTGESDHLDPRGVELVAALRGRTSLPVCLGIGISSAGHARAACEVADGVVVGSSIVRRMLEGESPDEVGGFVASLREAIDRG